MALSGAVCRLVLEARGAVWTSLNIPHRLGMALWLLKAGFQVASFIGFKDSRPSSIIGIWLSQFF